MTLLFLGCTVVSTFVVPGRSQTPGAAADTALKALSRSPNDEIRRVAQLLQDHFCNQPALLRVIGLLHQDLNYKPASEIGEAFLTRCNADSSVGFFTMQGWFRLTDFARALTTIDRFKEDVRSDAQFASWRGFILEKLDRNLEAAADFERALYLFTDLSEVGGTQFYYVTRTLKAAGRYCEAIHPMELFLSFNPQQRQTTEVTSIIVELQRLGRCVPDVPAGKTAIKLRRQGGVLVVDGEVNGVSGAFILDTGASTVHVTKYYAGKARVATSDESMVTITGATGTRRDYLAKAAKVTVGPALANDVTLTVASDDFSLGSGVDGLLGQTFLSRFKVYIDAVSGTLVLSERQ